MQTRNRPHSGQPGGEWTCWGPLWFPGLPKDDLVRIYRLYDFILDVTLTQIVSVQTLSCPTAGAV